MRRYPVPRPKDHEPNHERSKNLIYSAVLSFLPGAMPLMARGNYARELSAIFFLPWMLTIIEGGVIGVVTKVAFEGVVPTTVLNFAVATLAAAPALANIVSFIWVRLSHGHDKIRYIVGLQVTVAILVSTMALVPRSANGLHMLVLLAIAARVCVAGVVTLRSTVWAANYPTSDRARVAGKITTIQVELVALAGLIIGRAMELDEEAFHIIPPLFAGIGLIGVWRYSGIRVRQRRILRAAEHRSTESDGAPSLNPVALWRVLTNDKRFGAFMLCQMFIGIGNLMLAPVITVMLRDRFGIGYSGVIIAHTIPLAVMPLFIPLWARLLDRVHIIWFRSIHSWIFVAAAGTYFFAAAFEIPQLLYLASVIRGIAFGGGALAWTLGHLDFAPQERASQYMGVHVTLTGLRGLIAPLLGIQLYTSLEHYKTGSGSLVFLLSIVIITAGALGFLLLGRTLRARPGGLGKPADPGA
jgi:MFS family permease